MVKKPRKTKRGRPTKKAPVVSASEPTLEERLKNAWAEYNRAVAEKAANPSRQAIDDFHRADQLLRYLKKEQREQGPANKPAVWSRQR